MEDSLILIFDFGSQTCHLIGRRLRDFGINTKIINPEIKMKELRKLNPAGIIFSGGPASVYEKNAPTVDSKIFNLKVPFLGICYGWQLIAHLLGGKVVPGFREYGPATLKIKNPKSKILKNIPLSSTVWLSHGDTVVKLPKGFKILGSTKEVRAAFVTYPKGKIFGVQFHPEVEHTKYGKQILRNFVKLCGLKTKKSKIDIEKIIEKIKNKVGQAKVVAAVSGGIDSTVMAVLVGKAIGGNFVPIYIDNGLMRPETKEEIKHIFNHLLGVKPRIVQAKRLFLKRLENVVNPERKRQVIGKLYIKLFEREARKIRGTKYLAQGTIYSDVIESKGTQKADKIKSHHNVAGLPKKLNLKLIEPLRFFYKDEVRWMAKELGLPESVIYKQPFPGPGNAIRIIGKITHLRLRKQQMIDQIILDELRKVNYLRRIFQSFPVMTGIKSTAVKGDSRFYGEVVALRIYESSDIMTATWSKLPYKLLQKITSRILNEVPGISRVVYDLTTKPPATMEWE